MRLLAGSPTSAHPREQGQKSVFSHGEGTGGEMGMGEMLLSSAALAPGVRHHFQKCKPESKNERRKF